MLFSLTNLTSACFRCLLSSASLDRLEGMFPNHGTLLVLTSVSLFDFIYYLQCPSGELVVVPGIHCYHTGLESGGLF